MKTAKKWDEKLPVATQIRTMKVGDTLAFPKEKTLNIRANLSTYGLVLNRKYTSHINREGGCVEVTRHS